MENLGKQRVYTFFVPIASAWNKEAEKYERLYFDGFHTWCEVTVYKLKNGEYRVNAGSGTKVPVQFENGIFYDEYKIFDYHWEKAGSNVVYDERV